MAEGFFRSKKGFTVVQNEITRDVNISLKAKGLYLVIQAYISMPDKKWTKEDFMRLAKEGKKAFDSAWKELKESGYLKVHIMSDNGRWRTEYELLDEPEEGPHTLYHNADGKVTSDNLQRAEKKKNNLVSEEEKDHYPQMVRMVSKTITPLSVVMETVAMVTVVMETILMQMGVTIIKTII